jgi:GNAT superfamily N-acetyltransferase
MVELQLRSATADDVALLAELNRQLIEDEAAGNTMSVAELAERMRAWLAGEYDAVIFQVGSEVVAYALYRPAEGGLYLRQFFVVRSQRRQGVGRQAIALFQRQVLPTDAALSLEVLSHNRTGIAFWCSLGFQEHALSFRLLQ